MICIDGVSVINLTPSFGTRSGHTTMGFDILSAVSAVVQYLATLATVQ